MAKLISEEPAQPDQVMSVQIPTPAQEEISPDLARVDLGAVLDLAGDLLMQAEAELEQAQEAVRAAEEAQAVEIVEEEDLETPQTVTPLKSDQPAPKTPEEEAAEQQRTKHAAQRKGFARILFGGL